MVDEDVLSIHNVEQHQLGVDVSQLCLHFAKHVAQNAQEVIPVDGTLLKFAKGLVEELYIAFYLGLQSFEKSDQFLWVGNLIYLREHDHRFYVVALDLKLLPDGELPYVHILAQIDRYA